MMNYSRRRLDRLEKTPTPTLTMMTKNRVARRRGRGPASARASSRAHRSAAVCPHPPGRSRSRLARRRPDARASRAGETRRRRGARAGRASVRRRGRATVALDASRESPLLFVLSPPSVVSRARPPDASTSLDRRTASCVRSMASRRGRSSSRRIASTESNARATGSVGRFFFSLLFIPLSLFSRNGVARARTPRVAARRRLDRIHTESSLHACTTSNPHPRARSRRRTRAPPVAGTRTGTLRDGRIRFTHDASSTPDPPSTRARPRAIETDVFFLSLSFFSTHAPASPYCG